MCRFYTLCSGLTLCVKPVAPLANLAVLSGPGVVRFFDGNPLRYTRGRYFRYRQALQRKRKTGMIKRSKGRESRWVRCENHRLSRQIVDTVAACGGVLHVEKLLGIRDRTKKTREGGPEGGTR